MMQLTTSCGVCWRPAPGTKVAERVEPCPRPGVAHLTHLTHLTHFLPKKTRKEVFLEEVSQVV